MDNNEQRETEKLAEFLMKPALTGVYFSKYDIVAAALALDSAVTVGDRKMMFKDLFKLVDSPTRLEELLSTLKMIIESKIEEYLSLQTVYPTTTGIFDNHIALAKKTILHLSEIKDEIYL
jgi:hypothetical protein